MSTRAVRRESLTNLHLSASPRPLTFQETKEKLTELEAIGTKQNLKLGTSSARHSEQGRVTETGVGVHAGTGHNTEHRTRGAR